MVMILTSAITVQSDEMLLFVLNDHPGAGPPQPVALLGSRHLMAH